MIGSLATAFARARAEDRAALVAFLVAGDPSPDAMPALLRAAVAGGADIIELGFPYTDPLADGPVIQSASGRAIAAGMDFDGALACAHAIRDVPVIAFGYYNPLFVRGIQRSARDLARSGFAGIVAADLPPEESALLEAACAAEGLALPYLVAPSTPLERIAAIGRRATGFVYAVSRLGVTGANAPPAADIVRRIEQVKSCTDLPCVAGFGIGSPSQAAAIAAVADGVVVGSALVAAAASAPDIPSACAAVESLCSSLSRACRRCAKMPAAPA